MNRYISLLKNKYLIYTTPYTTTADQGLPYWRERVLLKVVFVLFYFAIFAYIPSVILAVANNLWSIVIVDTAVYIIMLFLYKNKNISVKLRAYTILLISYVLGVFLVLAVGPFGAGYLWIFVLPLLAAALIERRSAYLLIIINIFTLILLGIIQHYYHPNAASQFGFSITSWIVISANFIFLNVLLTFSIIVILRGLEETIANEKIITSFLEKRNKEIISAKEEAENANKMKSEFLAQMSHEIRTPINTILSFSSLIKNEINNDTDDSINEYFSSMTNAGKRIIRTIDLILNMAEIQTATFKAIKKDVKLDSEIIDKLVHEYKAAAFEKKLNLYFENKSDDTTVYADEYTLTQIFANLIDNAVKYTTRGEVKLTLCNEAGTVVVNVEDTGIGISQEYLNNLFTPFSQEDNGYSRKYEGNGLGLSLVKKYCEINNAAISVESKKGFGTKVSVKFTK